MRTIYLGPLPKITLWMRIKRMWCKHKNTFTQGDIAYAHKDNYVLRVNVPKYWQCHDCGVSWGKYDSGEDATVSLKGD